MCCPSVRCRRDDRHDRGVACVAAGVARVVAECVVAGIACVVAGVARVIAEMIDIIEE